MKRLFIAEKPSVAKVIAESLGIKEKQSNYIICKDDSYITWCFGHMFELEEPDEYLPDDVPLNNKGKKIWRLEDLPIFPAEFKLVEKSEVKEQLKAIKKLLKDAPEIVHCGDPDREGQLLVDEVLTEYKVKAPVKRYWANAQDKASVDKALSNLEDNSKYFLFGEAAKYRGYADWIVGINLTRAYTIKARSLVTMGRVQSPTLKLVVDRDRTIANFKSVDYFKIFALQNLENNEDLKFTSELITKDLDCTNENDLIIDKSKADEIISVIKVNTGTIESFNKKLKQKFQPLGYSLADITLKCSSLYGFSAKKTLDVCQSLYEKKFTTYPRTDCKYLPELQYNESGEVLDTIAQNNPMFKDLVANTDRSIHSKTWNSEKTTAHHAIIPTLAKGDFNSLTDDEKNVYNLVAINFIEQFYHAKEFYEIEIISKIDKYSFKSSGTLLLNEGWEVCEKILKQKKSSDKEKEENISKELLKIDSLEKGAKTNCFDAQIKSAKTQPPEKFTEGSLIKAMENIYKYIDDEKLRKMLKDGDGIGTSATRAGIISELKRKNYLKESGKFIVSTDVGQKAVDLIPDKIKSPVLTAIFEGLLSQIEDSSIDSKDFLAKQEDLVRTEIENVKNKTISAPSEKSKAQVSSKFKCKVCGKGLIRRESKTKKGVFWWGCSGYPECKQTYFDDKGKPKLD